MCELSRLILRQCSLLDSQLETFALLVGKIWVQRTPPPPRLLSQHPELAVVRKDLHVPKYVPCVHVL